MIFADKNQSAIWSEISLTILRRVHAFDSPRDSTETVSALIATELPPSRWRTVELTDSSVDDFLHLARKRKKERKKEPSSTRNRFPLSLSLSLSLFLFLHRLRRERERERERKRKSGRSLT